MVFALAILALQPLPIKLDTKITEMSVFRRGIALIVREGKVPSGDSVVTFDTIPNARDGTFWYDSPDGAQVDAVTTTLDYEEQSKERKALTVGDYLYANVGKRITMTVNTVYNQPPETIIATLDYLGPAPYGTATLRNDDGKVITIPAGSITSIITKGLNDTIAFKKTVPVVHVRCQVHANKTSRLRTMSIEGDTLWTVSHLVSLEGDASANVVSKAQLVVASHKLEDTKVHVLTGQPVLETRPNFDLVSGFSSLNAYSNGSDDTGLDRIGDPDPYRKLGQALAQLQTNQDGPIVYSPSATGYQSGLGGGGVGGGGFGGSIGGFGGGGLGSGNRGDEPYANKGTDTDLQRVEDLFEYDLGLVTLPPGGRYTKVLSNRKTQSETVYLWDGSNPVANDTKVRKVLRLINNTGSAWADGPALILKGTTLLAQLNMPFTAIGQKADLGLGRAQDIRTQASQVETGRTTRTITPYAYLDVNNLSTFEVENTRNVSVNFEIETRVTGIVTDKGIATVVRLAREGTILNPVNLVTWKFPLAPHEKKQLSIRFRTSTSSWINDTPVQRPPDP